MVASLTLAHSSLILIYAGACLIGTVLGTIAICVALWKPRLAMRLSIAAGSFAGIDILALVVDSHQTQYSHSAGLVGWIRDNGMSTIPALLATLGGILAWLRISHNEKRPRNICSKCGYLLYGLTVPRCPECGEQFDPTRLSGDIGSKG